MINISFKLYVCIFVYVFVFVFKQKIQPTREAQIAEHLKTVEERM